MKWGQISGQTCSIARALSLVGDRWTMVLIRDAFLRTRRFSDFARRNGIARNVLAGRLERLVSAGIFERHRYQKSPERFEYRLTAKGRDLYPTIMSLIRWGDRWLDEGRGRPVEHVHLSCGRVMHAVATCSECGEPLDPRDVDVRAGPGLERARQRRRREPPHEEIS